jgi:hypothetical protein
LTASPDSVRVNDVVLGFSFRVQLGLGAAAMEASGMDGNGWWPAAPGSESSHPARHGLSRRAFTGDAAAAAAASLDNGLLWPAAASAWSAEKAAGFSFKSDPSGTTSVFSRLGRVTSGIFSH